MSTRPTSDSNSPLSSTVHLLDSRPTQIINLTTFDPTYQHQSLNTSSNHGSISTHPYPPSPIHSLLSSIHQTNPILLQDKKSLTDLAKQNPSQIGDPVSLKAETSNTSPTENDRPNKTENKDKKSLKELAEDKLKSNPSALGDPISLKAETSDSEPTDQDRPNKAKSARSKL